MVDLIGFELTLKLCREMGGMRLRVPLPPVSERHMLVTLLGSEEAQRFADAYQCTAVEIPLLVGIDRLLRDAAIRADFDADVSVNLLCRRYRMSAHRIRQILKESGVHIETTGEPA